MTLKEAQKIQSKLFPKSSLKSYSETWEEYSMGKKFFDSKLGKSLKEVLQSLKIPYTMNQNEYAWNGKELSLHRRTLDIVFHDIAHFQLSSKRRRKLPEFGLGSDPDYDYEDHKRLRPTILASKAQEEEELASVLGILWEKAMGLTGVISYQEHSWSADQKGFNKRLQKLYKIGLIDNQGTPMITAR